MRPPPLMRAEHWDWEPFRAPLAGKDMSVGTDPSGTRWLVKAEGSFYSYRERVFGGLCHELGVSCQPSVYLWVPEGTPPYENSRPREHCQVALALLPEHCVGPCRADCSLEALSKAWNGALDKPDLLTKSEISYAESWIEGDALGYLCGANERYEKLITRDHELYLIDNSQVFSSSPADVWQCPWLRCADGTPSATGFAIIRSLCKRFSLISDQTIQDLCMVPDGYTVDLRWEIMPLLREAREAANRFRNG